MTVTGRIERNGGVSEVTAVDAKADPPDWGSIFSDQATQNLRTWRFEPGRNVEDIRIRYRFDVAVTSAPLEP